MEGRLCLSGSWAGDLAIAHLVEQPLPDHAYPALVDTHDLTAAAEIRADYGFGGAGQTVAVIDSGIAYDHVALGGGFGDGYRVVGGFDFTEEYDADPYDDRLSSSHGTHVAGIIGSSDPLSPGVAPEVDLVALRVINDRRECDFRWIEKALQWVHTNRNAFEYPITTVNVSVAVHWNSDVPPGWANLENELAQLQADGIFVSVAAGNRFASFPEPGLSYPAASPYVVPVGAVYDDGRLTPFTQRHQRMIAAPGYAVRSTVADHAGNGNGIADDFDYYSGTSMAAPYVAGAAVLLRQAYEFAGLGDVTQQTLYELMFTTADAVYDAATGQSYQRLNLQRAFDAVMPADDFGSTPATAHSVGTVVGSRSVAGTVGRLDDQDWFTFTAGTSGTVTVSADVTHDLLPQWQLAGDVPIQFVYHENALSFDVVAGQTYTLGLTTGDGLGHYTLQIDGPAPSGGLAWGTVLQSGFAGYQIDGQGRRFTLTAGADGVLSIEAFDSAGAGSVDLQLFDARGQLVGSGHVAGDSQRLDVTASAGETFHLQVAASTERVVDFRVTNLVRQLGDTLHVLGTDGDDRFTFTASAAQEVIVNGVAYRFDPAMVRTVTFDGLAGHDTALLAGTGGDDLATLRPGAAEMDGPGYQVKVSNVQTVTVSAGAGDDRAVFYDSPGNDRYVAAVQYASMKGDGFVNRAEGFETVSARATEGGFDVAQFYDSPGDDNLIATPGYGALSGDGFLHRVDLFEQIHAYAVAGGKDTAVLGDSAGDDTFVADPIAGALYGEGFFNRAKFFESVHAYAVRGGTDAAQLYDSAGDDTFFANAIGAALFGEGFFNRAKLFEDVRAYATEGGNDVAELHDSPGDDQLVLWPGYASLRGEGFRNRAYAFDRVDAQATEGGKDTAVLGDSAGDDTLIATPTYATLSGDGFSSHAESFEAVHAYAVAGGTDTAIFYDSAGDDTFVDDSVAAVLFGEGFFNRAKFFEHVHAHALSGGNDRAELYDSAGDDDLHGLAGRAWLADDAGVTWLYGFDQVRARADNGGTNRSDVAAVDFVLQMEGDWKAVGGG